MKSIEQLTKQQEEKGFNIHRHRRIRQLQLRARATKHELMVKRLLDQLEIKYMFQKGFTAGGVCYLADFYLPRPWKIVIEVDGPSHFTLEGIAKDRKRDEYFTRYRRCGLLHITNEDVETITADGLRQLLEQTFNASYLAKARANHRYRDN